MIQVPTMPTLGSAQVKSPSHGCASAPSPMASRNELRGPRGARIQRQMTAMAVGAMT